MWVWVVVFTLQTKTVSGIFGNSSCRSKYGI